MNRRNTQNRKYIKNEDKAESIDKQIISEIAFLMQECYYDKDTIIMHNGDLIDSILFIVEGEVEVLIPTWENSHQFKLIDKLKAHSTFGYHSVLLQCYDYKHSITSSKFVLKTTKDSLIYKLSVHTI